MKNNVDQRRSSLSDEQRNEFVRRGNIRLHQDIGLQHFASDGSGGAWTARRTVVEFLHSGRGDQFNVLSGITATTVDETLCTLEQYGCPSRFSHFCVTGLGFEFGKPFDTNESSSGASTTGTLTGPQSAFVKNISTEMIRNMLFGASLAYVIDSDCTQLLGPVDQFLSGKGFYGAQDLATNGIPSESERKPLRDHAIILPPSAPSNSNRNILRITFGNGRTTPVDPDAAVPAAGDVVAVPILLTLDGFYCKANGEPIDDFEARIAGLDAA
jgi:hypothetical protein